MKTRHFIHTFFAVLTATLMLPGGGNASAQSRSFSSAMKLERSGQFKKATAMLNNMLVKDSSKLSSREKRALSYQIERMRRIRIDYSLTADELFAQLQQGVSAITRPEFRKWIRQRKFDSRMIDDTLRFVNASRSNLFFRYPAIAARRMPPVDDHARHLAFLENCLSIERAADSLRKPYVLPRDFKMEMTVTVDSGTVSPGDTVKAWLPIPRKFPYQVDFELTGSSSEPAAVAQGNSPIRSVFMKQPADGEGGATFSIGYTYETYGVHFRLDPRRAAQYNKSSEIYRKYTSQAQNIVFTNKIKELSRKIVGKTTNPIVKAKKIYDWVGRNIKYSFAREYSTIHNISGYCLTKGYGDCGQEAMLFITLCRYNGIPARWQSGWYFFPGDKDIHDWTQIYVPPYGWVPVDPYMGILATRYMPDLTPAQRRVVRDFYFGGLDQYRMSANSGCNQKLEPPKKYFRSDNVDFQRGEVETNRRNIYFNKFNYGLKIEEDRAAAE